jgi:hypothetical protein
VVSRELVLEIPENGIDLGGGEEVVKDPFQTPHLEQGLGVI